MLLHKGAFVIPIGRVERNIIYGVSCTQTRNGSGNPPTMTAPVLSKSQLQAKLLAYLRQVEHEHQPLIITHAGKPVLQIAPYTDDSRHILRELRGSVVSYVHPTDLGGEERQVSK
jgi:prevent-host-death family protein